MKAQDLVFNVIYPACQIIDAYSLSAVALLAGTAAVESNIGEYAIQTTYKYGNDLKSFNGGFGLFQGQLNDHNDAIVNYLNYNPDLKAQVMSWNGHLDGTRMMTDMIYAAIFARIHYLRIKESLPDHNDIQGLANYWKSHYNSSLGAGTASRFVQCYPRVQEAVNEFASFMGK